MTGQLVDVGRGIALAYQRLGDGAAGTPLVLIAGVGRELAGILKSGDRTRELRDVTAPTLVLHGDRDLMVNPTGGARTAQAIPAARLRTEPGMGHDLPEGTWPTLAELIDDHIRTSAARSTSAPQP